MPASVKIRKGLDIRLKGGAQGDTHALSAADRFSIHPTDFHGLVPRMAVKAGTEVKAGDVLFTDKKNPSIQFVSAISGTAQEPVRGEKRRILRVDVVAGGAGEATFPGLQASASAEDVRSAMLAHGFWPMLRQRPFDVMPAPDSQPRDIFVSAHDSAPLAPSAAQVLGDRMDAFRKGLAFLNTLMGGGKQLGVEAGDDTFSGVTEADIGLLRPAPVRQRRRSDPRRGPDEQGRGRLDHGLAGRGQPRRGPVHRTVRRQAHGGPDGQPLSAGPAGDHHRHPDGQPYPGPRDVGGHPRHFRQCPHRHRAGRGRRPRFLRPAGHLHPGGSTSPCSSSRRAGSAPDSTSSARPAPSRPG